MILPSLPAVCGLKHGVSGGSLYPGTSGSFLVSAEVQKTHIRKAGIAAGFGNIGWHTFRHSYRSWLDDTGAPLTVQKELMRHASIQTTMNIYGKAMTEMTRQAHTKVVELVLKKSVKSEA